MTFEAIIIGGSYAGLSSALTLARARRRVLLIDQGIRRNRFASHSHGFLTQDGTPPDEIVAQAKAQISRYPNVTWLDARAETATGSIEDFTVEAGGAEHRGRRLILATGVIDVLPEIDGIADRWGKSIFHCPYCHGYELDVGRIGVVATSPLAMHQALMLPDWGPTTLLLNDAFEPDLQQMAALQGRGTAVETSAISHVSGTADVHFTDGRLSRFDGLFVAPTLRLAGDLAEWLGCAIDETPMGHCIRTDAMKATTVAGIFACGDAARAAGNVTFAVADGTLAALGAHRSLMGFD
ncbi:NAD(P)/FAD-dependent oxidoreductase [Rhizobium sp. 0TCS1.26]|uniref:NAD(P)/FAD-dependent oxidoreductase n=1 Tax=Rhizobium sp. 0TCS1.26 TaxID=3142623 RepID=UPI003D29CB7A